MPFQAFVDDSGGKGHSRHFVLVGLIGHSEGWAQFSDEWRACLAQPPAVKYFKMREAAACAGEFYRLSTSDRDAKLRVLARIINRYAQLVTYSMIDLDAHAETWGATLSKPLNEPYFFPFQNTILAACFSLWDAGLRERFEIIFDEQVIFGPRAKAWYPVLRDALQYREPEAHSIMPVDPIFRTDDEFLPIQAADLYAWCFRRGTDTPENRPFEWLLDELKSVTLSKYSQYYDRERMETVTADSLRQEREGLIPMEVVKKYREMLGG